MPDDPSKDAPHFIMAPPSPLLANTDWIVGFRWMTERLLATARKLARHGSMPAYRQMLIETEWKPILEGLAAHVMKAVEDGRNGPLIRSYVLHGNIPEAYQLAYAMLREISLHDRPGAVAIPITALEGIHELLADWQAPAGPAATPRDDRQGADPDASGTEAPPPSGKLAAAGPSVSLGKRADEPTVNGKRKKRLTVAQYDVLSALLAVGDGGLSKDSLATESGHGDAHRVLGRLADSDPDWGSVILM